MVSADAVAEGAREAGEGFRADRSPVGRAERAPSKPCSSSSFRGTALKAPGPDASELPRSVMPLLVAQSVGLRTFVLYLCFHAVYYRGVPGVCSAEPLAAGAFSQIRHLSKGWRRERDSNPRRAFDPYTLSRGAPSTTRPSLRRASGCRPPGGAIILNGCHQGKKATLKSAQPV